MIHVWAQQSGTLWILSSGFNASTAKPNKSYPYWKCITCTNLGIPDLARCHVLGRFWYLSTFINLKPLRAPQDRSLADAVCIFSYKAKLPAWLILETDLNWLKFRPVWFKVVVGWHKVTFRVTVTLLLRPVSKLRKSPCPSVVSLALCNCFQIKTTWKKKGWQLMQEVQNPCLMNSYFWR